MEYTPKKYVFQIEVKAADLDELMHVNNVVYISYLQQAAISHWYSAVPEPIREPIRWVVKKHSIEYFKAAFENDSLEISTWIESFNSLTCTRFYEIYRGNDLIVKAETLWLALDTQSMKPKRIDTGIYAEYFCEN
jgi:acyl-CoA thioester hydrolase